MTERMIVTVVGLGHIGLPMALLSAKAGYRTYGYDIDAGRVESLQRGELPFHEPGLEELFLESRHNFEASDRLFKSDVIVISVPTPFNEKLKCSDMSCVTSAAGYFPQLVKENSLVILESTVPPGTSRRTIIPALEKLGIPYSYCFCPERAMPGSSLVEMTSNSRLIGADDEASLKKAVDFYRRITTGELVGGNIDTVEFVKLIENTYRDVNIAFANEIAKYCERRGMNAWEAIALANRHPRVNIHRPGPGVGGHCIPVDPYFILESDPAVGIIQISRAINDSMPKLVAESVKAITEGIGSPSVAILGVAYKPDVDDVRESPALSVGALLSNAGIKVRYHDPLVTRFPHPILNLEESVFDADVAVILTGHEVFKNLSPRDLMSVRKKVVYDCTNSIDFIPFIEEGFECRLLGSGRLP